MGRVTDDDSFVDMDDDDDIHNVSMHDASGRTWTETRDGRFVSGDHDAYSDYHGYSDPTERFATHTFNKMRDKVREYKANREKRAINKDEQKHEEKMAKIQNKGKLQQMLHDPRIKMLSKVALAFEVLKFMIDHHDDKMQNDKDKEKLKLAEIGKSNSKQANTNRNAMAKKLQAAGFMVEPKDVKDVMSHISVGQGDNQQGLVQYIDQWWSKLKSLFTGGQVSVAGKNYGGDISKYGANGNITF